MSNRTYKASHESRTHLPIAFILLLLMASVLTCASADTLTVLSSVSVGQNPYLSGANPVTNKVYIANALGNTVSVIDGITNAELYKITVGTYPRDVAVDSTRNLVYVTNRDSNSISVIDGSTDTVSQNITVPYQPWCVAVNPATNKIYVGYYYSNHVSEIDMGTGNISTIAVSYSYPYNIVVNTSTNTIYTTLVNVGVVTAIDGATFTVTENIVLGLYCRGITVDSTRNLVYTADSDSNTVGIIDGSTNTVLTTLALPTTSSGGSSWPYAIFVNSATNRIYVSGHFAQKLFVIDGYSDTVIGSASVGDHPTGIAFNTANHLIYVSNSLSNTVSVIKDALGMQIDMLPGVYPNTINMKNVGKVPVAVFSTDTFDATTVDPSTVQFAGAKTATNGKKAGPVYQVQDLDGNGTPDLILYFNTTDLDLTTASTEATLTGQTYEGDYIQGTDSVLVIKPRK